MHTADRVAPMSPKARRDAAAPGSSPEPAARRQDRRPWYAVDFPSVLVFIAFVMAIEAILVVAYYRRKVAMISPPGRYIPSDEPHTNPFAVEMPETPDPETPR